MSNKELRIIIADAKLSRQVQIEKSLNKLGYYRILPIQTCNDLWMLSDAFQITFDVLIAHKDLLLDAEKNPAFFQTSNTVNHALLYGSQQVELTTVSFTSTKTRRFCAITVPNDELIADFMNQIDPPSVWECLKDVAWIKNTCTANGRLVVSNKTKLTSVAPSRE